MRPDGWPDLGAVSFRRAAMRSNSDPRDAPPSEMLGEDACGTDLVILCVLSPSVLLGLPTSDGCGRLCPALLSVFGEYRNVLGEKELDRSGLVLGAKLRELGALGLKLGEGLRLAGGLNEGRDGAIWNDLPELNDGGLEGVIGADLDGLKEPPDGELRIWKPAEGPG